MFDVEYLDALQLAVQLYSLFQLYSPGTNCILLGANLATPTQSSHISTPITKELHRKWKESKKETSLSYS